MLIVADVDPASRKPEDIFAKAVIRNGVELQTQVFRQQGVSFPDKRVLSYADSVGTSKEPGSLDGTQPHYRHLYLLWNREHFSRIGPQVNGIEVVGMMATQVLTKVPGIDGHVRLDYFPPLVLRTRVNSAPYVKPGLIEKDSLDLDKMMTPVEILDRFNMHIPKLTLERLVVRMTDGIGISPALLSAQGYLQSDVQVWVPPMDARTVNGYKDVLPEPVTMHAKFYKGEPMLRKEAAEALMIGEYLIGGYVDTGQVQKLGIVNTNPRMLKALGLHAYGLIPAVKASMDSIAHVAARNDGYIPFHPVRN